LLNAKLAGGLSWATVHHLQCVLGKIMGTAVEWGYIEVNPVRVTRLPRQGRQKAKSVLTPPQVRLFPLISAAAANLAEFSPRKTPATA